VSEAAVPIPAATVVLLRDGPTGVEALMLRKTAGQSFGGNWVFPGGKVEPGDERPGASEVEDARRAAERETAEETGLVLDDADLVPFAHWIPPPEAPKRFSTWFFVAALPPGLDDVVVDGGEIGDHVWTTAAAALDRHARGEVELAPPTWMSLHGLLDVTSPAQAVERARERPVSFHATRIATKPGHIVTLWQPDAAYESGDLEIPGPRNRLLMPREGAWTLERSTS
jgi:8-oxo-dGTP pyrophosphatase MutT (NUDIX family)